MKFAKPVRRFALACTLTLFTFCGCTRSHTSAEPSKGATVPNATVRVARPRHGDIARTITLPGLVRANQQATLYAKVAGYLKSIHVDKGDRVKAGDLLAEIEAPELLADLAKFRAEVDIAAINHKRIRDAQKSAPDLIVPQAVDEAEAKFKMARANLERTEILLSFCKITAPFSGFVSKRYVDPGAFIPSATSGSAAQNAALLTAMDFSRVRVEVAVPETEVPLISNGLPAKIALEELPGRAFQGTVTRFAYALDEATKTMLAEIELENPKLELRPGMYTQVILSVERKTNTLLVPMDALVVEKTKNSVFVVQNGTAHKLGVKTGFTDGSSAEILEGLAPEQTVILVGKQSLNDGQPVVIAEGK